MKLQPYPEYKDSGVPWLGKIPAHWDAIKLKRVSHVQTGVTLGKRYEKTYLVERPYLRVANVQNGFLNLNHIKTVAVPGKEALSAELRVGDVVITEGGDIDKLGRGAIWNGEIEHCLHQNHIFAIRPVLASLIPGFLSRMMESHHGRSYFYLTSKRTTNLASTNQTTLGLLPLFLPSIDEQTQIARFLDWKTAQINKFIRNKRRLIELLKEQKQNVINQAVTRGLDPNVKLKPSGVEWIGDIPEHWEVTRIGRLLKVNSGDMISAQEEKTEGYPIYGGNGIRGYSNKWNTEGPIILLGRVGAKCGCVHLVDGKFWASEHALRVRLLKKTHLEFLALLLETANLNRLAIRTAQPLINSSIVRSVGIALPPDEEQSEIVNHVKEASETLDQAITRAQREIELMREYRTRLISDVVTGQVDVRGIEVPDVAEDELLAREEDTTDADDVMDDKGDMDETD